jgi:hypothetical protein
LATVIAIHAGNCFQEHPYHWPVMGYEDDMKIGTNKTWSVILKHTMHQITVLLSLVVLSNRRGKTISTEIS